MDSNNHTNGLVLEKSPIEFIVVGAKGVRHSVLLRSDTAQLDLVGFAASMSGKNKRYSPQPSFLAPRKPRILSSVRSYPLSRPNDEEDSREATYQFCWVGLSSEEDKQRIEELFRKHASDLQAGIDKQDMERIEWSLAPVLLECTTAEYRASRRQRVSRTLYLLFLVFIATVVGVWYFFIQQGIG